MNLASVDVRHGERGQVTVAVSGEVDLAVHDQLADTLKAIASGGAKRVLVDLSKTSFLDSGGIRALITGLHAAHAHQAEYTVTGAAGIVRQVLEVTGVLAALTGQPSADIRPAA